MLVNSDLEENKDCFFNNTKLEASADVIYNYQYYDIIGIIKYLCGIIVLNSVTYSVYISCYDAESWGLFRRYIRCI